MSRYDGKDELIISFAGDIYLQKSYVNEAMVLYTSIDYSANYQQVLTAMKQQTDFGK